jgi:hypothetical protein
VPAVRVFVAALAGSFALRGQGKEGKDADANYDGLALLTRRLCVGHDGEAAFDLIGRCSSTIPSS